MVIECKKVVLLSCGKLRAGELCLALLYLSKYNKDPCVCVWRLCAATGGTNARAVYENKTVFIGCTVIDIRLVLLQETSPQRP